MQLNPNSDNVRPHGLAPVDTLYRWSKIDTNLSLFAAWFINAAILIVAGLLPNG